MQFLVLLCAKLFMIFSTFHLKQSGLFSPGLLCVSQPLLEVSLHVLSLLCRAVVDGGDDLLGTEEPHKLSQLREAAVFTVRDTCA